MGWYQRTVLNMQSVTTLTLQVDFGCAPLPRDFETPDRPLQRYEAVSPPYFGPCTFSHIRCCKSAKDNKDSQ